MTWREREISFNDVGHPSNRSIFQRIIFKCFIKNLFLCKTQIEKFCCNVSHLFVRWKTFLPCSENIPFNFLSQHGVKPARGRFKLQWHLLAPSQLWQLLQLLLCNNDNGCKCDQYIVFNKSISKRNRKCMRWNSSINKTFQLIFHFTIFTYFSGRMKLVNP